MSYDSRALRDLTALVCAPSVALLATFAVGAAELPSLRRADGVELRVSAENTLSELLLSLPGYPPTEYAARILFPEHVTARRAGTTDVEHLYLFREGQARSRPVWRRKVDSIEYTQDLSAGVHMLARATLQSDGILFHYEFSNREDQSFEMIYAVTDPRFKTVLRDVRLERTYVHHAGGFDPLASETPERLTEPLDKWLPARYLAFYTWPVPTPRIEHRDDGITYYNKSRAVDEPLIATVSSDGRWVAATFTKTTGNVWSNPELTCQHVDPQKALPGNATITLETKLVIIKGGLADAQRAFLEQRNTLK